MRISGLGSGGSSNMKGQTREVVLVVRPARMKTLDRREELEAQLDRCQGGGVAAGGVFEVSDPAGCVSGQV